MTAQRYSRALVTGASSGIGEALAVELAGRQVDLVLVARSADKLQTLAQRLRTDHDVEVEVLAADLTTDDGLTAVEDRLRQAEDPVDLLVNNAGVGQVGDFAELDVDGAQQAIQLNTIAPVRLTHAALPALRQRGGGVLNVSSIAAGQPVPKMATYAATKAFLSSWSEALHEELRGSGVQITALCPGFTRSGFVDAADAEGPASRIPGLVWDEPAEVARAGVEGLLRGRASVVPSGLYRAGVLASSVTPSAITRRVVGTVTRRMV